VLFDGVMAAEFKDLCLDADNHQALADWWCAAMGYRRSEPDRDPASPIPIVDPAGRAPLSWIDPGPEGKIEGNEFCVFAR
jgi:hypothetical protein